MKQLVTVMLGITLLSAEPATVEQLFNVKTTSVKREDITVTQKNYGYVVADESSVCSITPRFGGYITELYADKTYGLIKKGEPLMRVYSPELLQAKEEYLNSYRYVQKRGNDTMLQSARSKLLLLGMKSEQIEALVKSNKADAYTTYYAPCSGYIFEKQINRGSAFHAQQSLFTVVDLDHVWIEAKIYQKEMARLNQFRSFSVHSEATGKSYEAKKLLIHPRLDIKEATATLRLGVENRGHTLYPGMYVSVISSKTSGTQLTLPRSAVIRKHGSWYVFVSGEYEGEYEPTEVSVAPADGERYIILDGLNEGDEVVSNALFMMDADARINGLY